MGKIFISFSALMISFSALADQKQDPQIDPDFGSARVEVAHCKLPNQKCKKVVSNLDAGVAESPFASASETQGKPSTFAPKPIGASSNGSSSGSDSSSQ